MPDLTLTADANIVEYDASRMDHLEPADVAEYSLRHHLTKRLNDHGYYLIVQPEDEGWPVYDELQRPAVILYFGESQNSGIELGSDGSTYRASAFVFGRNDAERTRLAELIKKFIVRTIPIYDYVTGNEADPDPTGEYFRTDSVGWQKIRHLYNAPDAERYRAVVNAILSRAE